MKHINLTLPPAFRGNRDDKVVYKKRAYASMYFNYFYNIYLSRFTWQLPEEIVPQVLEDYLFWEGSALFTKNDTGNFFAVTHYAGYGMTDIYGFSNDRMGIAKQYVLFRDKQDSVLIRDSYTGYPMAKVIEIFANSLADMRITRDINVMAMRTPFILTGNSKQSKTLNEVFNSIYQGIPYIPLDKESVKPEDIDVLSVNASPIFSDLSNEMRQEIVSCLNILGVFATHSTKKERQNTAESVGVAGETEINRNGATDIRKRAASQINRMFGLNVTVEFNSLLPLPTLDGMGAAGNYNMAYNNLDKDGESDGNGDDNTGQLE